jgi:membrane protein YqaA with SNARE-associated domain
MRRVLWMLSLSALVPLIPFLVIGELPGERWLVATRDSAAWFGATGAGLLALDMLLPIPSSVIGALLGGRLGLPVGFACAFVGLSIGHLIGYGLGRLAPLRFAAELPAAPSRALVFLSRPVPVLAEAVAITAGAERMPLRAFVTSMGLGNAVYAAAMAANGAALLPQGLAGPGLILPMLVPVAGWWLARRH